MKISFTCPDTCCVMTSLHWSFLPFEGASAKLMAPPASGTNQDFKNIPFYEWQFYLIASRDYLEQFIDFTYSPKSQLLEHEKWAISC